MPDTKKISSVFEFGYLLAKFAKNFIPHIIRVWLIFQ